MIIAKSSDGRIVAMLSEYGLKPLVRVNGVWGTEGITGEELQEFVRVTDAEERLDLIREALAGGSKHFTGWECLTHRDGSKSVLSPDHKTELFWKPSFGLTGCFDDEERMPPSVVAWLFDFPAGGMTCDTKKPPSTT